jgi:hypothetical protein
VNIYNILKVVGGVAGIGGIAVGVLLIIFRDIIRKKIFPQLTKDQAYRLLKLISLLAFFVAIIGIAAYVIIELKKPQSVPTPTGFLEIWSDPEGADICIMSGDSIISSGSTTPDTFELTLGKYKYVLRKEGYEEFSLLFSIDRDKQWVRSDTITLKARGWLRIPSISSYESVRIDTLDFDTRKGEIIELDSGEHQMALVMAHPTRGSTHVKKWNDNVLVAAGSTTEVNLNSGWKVYSR